MARKKRVNKAREQLSELEWDYLRDRHDRHSTDPFIVLGIMVLEGDEKKLEELWQLHREVILAEHVKENPGTRPALWWQFDAPRLPMGTFPGDWVDGKLPQPRERIAGVGTAAYLVTSIMPSFWYGIADCWIGIDPKDPPVFESQAEYLKRNGFLFTGEERRADFEPEIISYSNFLSMTPAIAERIRKLAA